MLQVSEADHGATRVIATNDQVEIRLPENPTTGFQWQFDVSGVGRLRRLEDRFEQGSSAIGATGLRVVSFVTEAPGEVHVEAVERRAWEPPDPSSKRWTLHIAIR
jgi:inhibitor of cysteine peptidase